MGERSRRKRQEQPPVDTAVIDLRGGPPPPRPVPALPDVDAQTLHAQLVARRRGELARAEAQQQLEELRRRHWSADRVFEESRLGVDWWEHPLADPHAVLGLLPGDSLGDATQARRAIAKGVHPDVAPDEDHGAYRQMAAVNSAYGRMRRAFAPLPDQRTEQPAPRRGNQWSIALGQGGSTVERATAG
jgi:hypothetical protein